MGSLVCSLMGSSMGNWVDDSSHISMHMADDSGAQDRVANDFSLVISSTPEDVAYLPLIEIG